MTLQEAAGRVNRSDPRAVAAVLELSDERDLWQRRVLAAEIRGYRRGVASMAGKYDRGFADGIMAYKAAQHGLHRSVQAEMATWGGWRELFGDPRPGDYAGGPLPLKHPGMVWLGGPPVHHHRCARACYAYSPGWYTSAAAADILASLPGDYAEDVGRLRGLAGAA